MSDAFKKPIGIDWNAGGLSGLVKFENDNNLLVVFFTKAVPNPLASKEAGRVICEDHVFIRIQHPGETLNIIERPANDGDKQRFPRLWEAYVRNQAQVVEGTPIDLLFPNYPAVAENLRAYGVQTIEQCANLSAHAINSIGMGGQEYSNRAKKYLEGANTGKAFHTLQKELTDRNSEIRVLKDQMGKLQAKLDALLARDISPGGSVLNPPFIQGFDAQSERINANHATKELAKVMAPPSVEIGTKVLPQDTGGPIAARRGRTKITAQEAAMEAKEQPSDAA